MKKPYLTDYIYALRGVIPLDFCQKIVKENYQIDDSWQEHAWTQYDSSNKTLKVERREKELLVKTLCTDKKLENYIMESVVYYQQKMLEIGVAISINEISTPRINRYITGTDMAKHHDCIMSLFEKGVGSPTISIVGVLNDDYEGGDFIMFDKMKIELKAGDILLFPSNFCYTHEVTKVTKGERWSFVSWSV